MKLSSISGLGMVCLGMLAFGHPSWVQEVLAQEELAERQSRGTISVIGEATASALPDMAVVRFSVVTRNQDPEKARSANAEAAKAAMDVVRELIEDERRMRLESLRLHPRHEYDPQTQRSREQGYEAIRDIVVEVEDLEKVPLLVARIVQKGANRLNSVSYELQNQENVRNDALVQAVLNARQKATLMAEIVGASLYRVTRIAEQGTGPPAPVMRQERMESMAVSKSAAPEPDAYSPGEIEIQVQVDVTFALNTRH